MHFALSFSSKHESTSQTQRHIHTCKARVSMCVRACSVHTDVNKDTHGRSKASVIHKGSDDVIEGVDVVDDSTI